MHYQGRRATAGSAQLNKSPGGVPEGFSVYTSDLSHGSVHLNLFRGKDLRISTSACVICRGLGSPGSGAYGVEGRVRFGQKEAGRLSPAGIP